MESCTILHIGTLEMYAGVFGIKQAGASDIKSTTQCA